MTIAAGFVCNGGIVLCADTQETISGYIKTYDGKIDTCLYASGLVVAVAGSGTSDYIKTARSALLDDFPSSKSFPEVRTEMEERLLTFFDKHLARWAYFPEREKPEVELLIGVAGRKMPCTLFHYAGTSFHRVATSKAIGDGVLLANELINRYCFGNYNIEELSKLAIYILSKVKHGVDGCGGSTHLVTLRKGFDWGGADDKDVKILETAMLEIEKKSDKEFVKTILQEKLQLKWLSETKSGDKK
jgi:20S proteasome alpha/beta subunit